MNVGELIEALQEYPEESHVIIDTSDVGEQTFIFDVGSVEEGNNKITVYIVAE